MAGEFEICLPVAIAGEATAAALEALDLVQSLERQLSFFRPDSDISEINRDAADAAVEVEPRLFALLQGAMQLWRDSGGAYDLTATPLWEAWGFARRAGAIPSPEQLAEARTLVGGQWVELDEARKTIRFLRRGVRLNLGSIGKGYAVDRAVEHSWPPAFPTFSSTAAIAASPPAGRRPVGNRPQSMEDRRQGSASRRAAAGASRAARPRLGHVGGAVPIVSPSGEALWPHPRSTHRLAGRGRAFGHGPGAHGRGGRCPFHRLLRHGARGRHELLPAATPRSPPCFLPRRRATAGNCITMVWPRNLLICWLL